jgi:hypothetical protein
VVPLRRRLEALEAGQGVRHETPMALGVYFRAIENHRRLEAGEPPVPLTEEEEQYEREMNNDPEFQAYWELLEEQQIQRTSRERS